jgi:putative membrane protein
VNTGLNELPKIEQVMQDGSSVLPIVQTGVSKIHEWLNPAILTDLQLIQNIAQALNGGIQSILVQVENGTITKEQVAQSLQGINNQLEQLNTILATMKQLLTDLNNTAPSDNLQQLIATINSIQTQVSTLQSMNNQFIANVGSMTEQEFINKAKEIATVANTLVDGVNYLANKENLANIDAMLTRAENDLNYASDMLQKAQAMDLKTLLEDAKTTLSTSIDLLKKYQKQMPQIAKEISDANALLNGHLSEITNGINTGASLYQNELPIATRKLATAANFITNDWPSLQVELTNSLALANQKMPEITASVHTASDLITNYWPSIQDGIHQAANAIHKGEETTSLDEIIKLMKLDANNESQFLSNPVNLKTTNYYPIPNYGSASTPFYTALALWVGAVLFSSIATTKFYLEKEEKKKYTKREMYITRMLTFLIVGLLQALIAVLGNIFLLGAYVANPVLEVVFALLISLSFMGIVYFLVGMFDNLGKGLAIIILVLSISGGGGNFPIVLSGKFFQAIHPFLPFTYAVNLLRESTGGVLWASAYLPMIVLASVFLVVTIVGVIFAPRMQEHMKKVSQKVAQAHIFH